MKTTSKEKSNVVKYKSDYKLQILEILTNNPIKNVKVNLKVKNDDKYKKYTLKTDKKGFIKFNTKNLKLGYHEVTISSNSNKYSIFYENKIFVGELKKPIYLEKGNSFNFENGDSISTSYKKNKFYVFNNNRGTGNHIVVKAKVFFKNNKNNNLITTKTVKHNHFIKIDSVKGYTPFKAQVWYLQS